MGLPTPIGHGLAQQGMAGSFMMKGATLVLIEIIRAKEIMEAIEKYRINRIILLRRPCLRIFSSTPTSISMTSPPLRWSDPPGSALRPRHSTRPKELFDRLGNGSGGQRLRFHRRTVRAPQVRRTRGSRGLPVIHWDAHGRGDHWKVIKRGREEGAAGEYRRRPCCQGAPCLYGILPL